MHLFDEQTFEPMFLTLWAEHHLTLKIEDIFSKFTAEPGTEPLFPYSWVSLIPEPVWVIIQQDSGLRSCEDRIEQKEASDFGVMRHSGETTGKGGGSIYGIEHYCSAFTMGLGCNLTCLTQCFRGGGAKWKNGTEELLTSLWWIFLICLVMEILGLFDQ